MPLKPCIKATKNLNSSDVDNILESYDSYIETMEPDVAAKSAIDDAIESVKSEKKEYSDLFNETYPKEPEINKEKEVVKKPVKMPFTAQVDKVIKSVKKDDNIIYSKQPENFTQYNTDEKSKPKKRIQGEHLKRLVKIMQRDNPGTRFVNFYIRDTQAEAFGPDSIKKHGIIKGGFTNGTNDAVLIAENITDVNDAITVIRHEIVAHYGLPKLLNKEGQYDRLLKRVYNSKDGELKELYDFVYKIYPDLIEKNDIRSIAHEMLGRAAETKTESSLLDRIYDLIIKMLNKLGLVSGNISNKEVKSLIRSSSANLKRGTLSSQREYARSAKKPKDAKVSYSKKSQDVNDTPTDGNLGIPDEKNVDKFVRVFQDNFNRVKKLQETIVNQGGKVKTKSNVYIAEERSSGIITLNLDRLEDNSMKPMIDVMLKNDISLEMSDSYLMAKHAKERNDYVASLRDDMDDGGSGLTYEDAENILEQLSDKKEALEEVASYIYKVNKDMLKNLVKAGHMKQETADFYNDQFKYYVPLKGKSGKDNVPGVGLGYAITGDGIVAMKGRGAGNVAESPTAHTFAQAQSTIIRAGKTKVGQALVELVRDNPDPSLWSISKRTYKQFQSLYGEPFEGYDTAPDMLEEGLDYHSVLAVSSEERKLAISENRKPKAKVAYVLDPNFKRRDDVFSVMIEGEELNIKIEDELLIRQLKKLNAADVNWILRTAGKFNRYQALINTGLSLPFVFSNFIRDTGAGAINLGGEQSAKVAYDVVKKTPAAIRGIWQATFNTKGNSEYRDLYIELREEGGTVGFFGLEDIETKAKNIQKQLTSGKGVIGWPKRKIVSLKDLVLDMNLTVENGIRLSSYKVVKEKLIANGMSETDAKFKAASVAKNLTVNFNRKGEWAPVFNSVWLFSSTSIQGSARILLALKNRRVQKIVGTIAVSAFGQAMYNAASGDDDDGIPYWDKIDEYTKQTHMIFMNPWGDNSVGTGGGGRYTKIKITYGYNVFHYAGTAMHDMIFNDRKSAIQGSLDMISAIMNAYNPVQGADFLDTITPTILKPFEQDARNIDYKKSRIRPENPFDNYKRPESQKTFKSTSIYFKDTAKYLNELGFGDGDFKGGNESESGPLDFSPETAKHYIKWFTGGAGMFLYRSADVATKIATGEDVETRDIPIIRQFSGKPGSRFDTDRFYSAIEKVNAVENQLKVLKGTDKYSDYKVDNNEVHKLSIHIRKYKNKIKRLREKRDKAYREDDKYTANETTEKIRQKMMEFSTKYDDAIEAQK